MHTTASAEELKILDQLAKDKWGRWGGRDGKMARVRAQEEKLAAEARAKLEGSQAFPIPAPAVADSKGKKRQAAGSGRKEDAAAVERAEEAKMSAPSTSAQRRRLVFEVEVSRAPGPGSFQPLAFVPP